MRVLRLYCNIFREENNLWQQSTLEFILLCRTFWRRSFPSLLLKLLHCCYRMFTTFILSICRSKFRFITSQSVKFCYRQCKLLNSKMFAWQTSYRKRIFFGGSLTEIHSTKPLADFHWFWDVNIRNTQIKWKNALTCAMVSAFLRFVNHSKKQCNFSVFRPALPVQQLLHHPF